MSVVLLLFALGALACQAKSAYHKEVDEGDCKSHYPTWDDIHLLGIARQGPSVGWMVAMSSKHFAYHLSYQLTGNNSLPEADLQGLCLRVNRKGITSYYGGKELLFHCNRTLNTPVKCYSTDSTPHRHVDGPISTTLVWTDDNSHHLLVVLCASEAKQKYWFLASNEAVVDSEVKTKVLNIISDLGFDRNLALYHDYSKCTEATLGRKADRKDRRSNNRHKFCSNFGSPKNEDESKEESWDEPAADIGEGSHSQSPPIRRQRPL
ncbi:unnamed protein product [Orchesella dallaii]|uniref:Apolipoprotein D n=1 Tax=Orchesella dallaii TaxID=48710 RepID=A0ABP1PVX0_9HEXA